MNSIIAYNLYRALKQKNSFIDFAEKVLGNTNSLFKTALTSFMNNLNNNNISHNLINKSMYDVSLSDNDDADPDPDDENENNEHGSLTDDQIHKGISDNTNYFTETEINH